MISKEDYFMGRDVSCSTELTVEILHNAAQLLKVVNEFLTELGITSAKVSSGWRPASINSKVPNAAKRSLHMTGMAIDIKDDGTLSKLILDNLDKLKQHNLWMEDPKHTIGWVHLDLGSRTPREKNIFIP